MATRPDLSGFNPLGYLVETAMPGDTMTRQTPEVAIGRLHSTFAQNLANAIRQARAEGINVSAYSAYRPPGFGVGGYKDKFNSLHSYGLAVDVAGIGRPGSATAKRWYDIAIANGIFNPYGPNNGKEWNHFQGVPEKGRQFLAAHPELRDTITANGPIDLEKMWAASGIKFTKPNDPFGVARMQADMARARTATEKAQTLSRGSKGEAVRALQQTLADAGLYTGKIDGDYGRRTQDAVRAYQMRYGLDADGIAGPQTQKSLAATATPSISPAGLYPPPQTEPPPVWPDSFNPPSGLNVGDAFPETAAPFPGLPSPPPASAPIGRMDAPVPTVGPMAFDPARMVPDTRAKAPPETMPEMFSAQGANIRGDFVQPGQVPDMVARSAPDAPAAMVPEIAPKMLPEFSAFPARPEYPGALPAAAPPAPDALPPGFSAAMGSYRPMMPDELTRSIDATTRRKAAMDAAMASGAGQFLPSFDFATAPTPLGQDAVRPPPWSDRALMMGPPVREDITTANSPFAAGIDALPAPPKPYTPDFEFTAGPGGDPSLAQWLERNGPNAPKATAQGGPLDFLSGILPEQNLLRDLGLMGAGEASAAIPPASRSLPPPAPPPPPMPPPTPPAAPQSGVWDPFNTRDPNKDQSRHPAMGPLSLGAPMGGTRIPPTMVADASGALPDISVNDFAARFGPGAPPPATFPGRPGVPGALPAAPSPAPPRPIPGVATFPGPVGGIPAEPVVAPPPVGDPMSITPPFASGPTPPAPLPTPQPVKPPERKGLFGGPVGKAVLGLLGGIPGAALGIGTGGKMGTNFAGILGGGPPANNLFQSAGTSVSPNGMATTFGTWGNTGMRAVQGPNGEIYGELPDGTWAQAL